MPSSQGRQKTSPSVSARKTSPTQRFELHRTVDGEADMSNGHQLEEELARDLQQMKVRLQGTPGTVPPGIA
jgi:hypothetical protein